MIWVSDNCQHVWLMVWVNVDLNMVLKQILFSIVFFLKILYIFFSFFNLGDKKIKFSSVIFNIHKSSASLFGSVDRLYSTPVVHLHLQYIPCTPVVTVHP